MFTNSFFGRIFNKALGTTRTFDMFLYYGVAVPAVTYTYLRYRESKKTPVICHTDRLLFDFPGELIIGGITSKSTLAVTDTGGTTHYEPSDIGFVPSKRTDTKSGNIKIHISNVDFAHVRNVHMDKDVLFYLNK